LVSGIKKKVVAAAVSGATPVMLPKRNRRDCEDIRVDVRERLEFVWLERAADAPAAGLQAEPQAEP
jgi:ATP-dependent Lon protease